LNRKLQSWCKGPASGLKKLASLIECLEFDTEPNYEEMRDCLRDLIITEMETTMATSNIFSNKLSARSNSKNSKSARRANRYLKFNDQISQY
jgi:hypothetical protein